MTRTRIGRRLNWVVPGSCASRFKRTCSPKRSEAPRAIENGRAPISRWTAAAEDNNLPLSAVQPLLDRCHLYPVERKRCPTQRVYSAVRGIQTSLLKSRCLRTLSEIVAVARGVILG